MSLPDHEKDIIGHGSTEHDADALATLLDQCVNSRSDKDLMRFVKAAMATYRFKSETIAEIIKATKFGQAKVDVAVLLYPACADPNNFEQVVVEALPFKEDKTEVREKLKL